MFGAGWRCRPPWPFKTTLGFQDRCQSRLTSSSKWRSVKGSNLRWLFSQATAFQADPLPLWQHCKLARNRGVDPHSISAAHSFRNWCQSRPALFRILFGTAPRFRSSSSWVKAKRAPITPVRYVVREVRFELTCPWASGFEPDTYTSSVTRANGACRGT